MRIPFLDLHVQEPTFRNAITTAFERVMDSGWYVLGREVDHFEQEFSTFNEVNHCVGVGSGLDALHLLLRAYGIGSGDEVIVPSHTFIATWLAVTQCGATVVPVEPDARTYNIDPAKIEAKITQRTKAIMPVHLYGQSADMHPVMLLAEKYHLHVIEDAAQAQGSLYYGKKVGSLAHAAATSFYPGKNLGAFGDGGAVLTSDPMIFNQVKMLRNYGSSVKYQHDILGYNSRLDEMQAAFLREKLKRLDQWNIRRQHIASMYSEGLAGLDLILPFVPKWASPVWHLYVVASEKRSALQAYLAKYQISTMIHYPIPPHQQKAYHGIIGDSLPITERLAQQLLSLPIYPSMIDEQVEYVIERIQSFNA